MQQRNAGISPPQAVCERVADRDVNDVVRNGCRAIEQLPSILQPATRAPASRFRAAKCRLVFKDPFADGFPYHLLGEAIVALAVLARRNRHGRARVEPSRGRLGIDPYLEEGVRVLRHLGQRWRVASTTIADHRAGEAAGPKCGQRVADAFQDVA